MDPRMNSMQGLQPPLQPGMVQNPFTIGQAVDNSAMQNGLIPMQQGPTQNGIDPTAAAGAGGAMPPQMPMNSGAAPAMTPTNTAPLPVTPGQQASSEQIKTLAAGLAKLKGRFSGGASPIPGTVGGPMAGDPAPMGPMA